MLSTFTSHTPFVQNRRLERPLRQQRNNSAINYQEQRDSVVVLNHLNSLNPNLPKIGSTPSPLSSFTSGRSSRTSHFTSTSSMSSGGSIRSYQEVPRYRSSYESETTPTASSLTDARMTSLTKPKPPFVVTEKRSYVSRPSFESDTSSVRSWLDIKERKSPPPPLFLHRSNLHRKKTEETPVIEIIAPGPPRVESRLSSYSSSTQDDAPAITPDTPEFHMPTEEEIRRRRHEKVMRTLGERVPVELVYRDTKIPNVTVFPEPPSPSDSDTPRGNNRARLSRRGSFTLSSFPNLTSVASTLTGHGRNKSRDVLQSSEPSPSTTPTPLSFSRQNRPPDISTPTLAAYRSATHPRPERPATVYSPIIFADRPISQVFHIPNSEEEVTLSPTTMSRWEAERAAKLARRASLSTSTFLPSSPMRDGFRDRTSSPRSSHLLPTNPPPRRESMMLSPLVFLKDASPVPHKFAYTVSDDGTDETVTDEKEEEEDDDDDSATQGASTPPRHKVYAQSESGHGLLSSDEHGYHSQSNPHLPMHIRPETPFQDSGVPMEAKAGFLAPPGWTKDTGKDLIQRKERRQGWSGEWNQGDMQDVIRKLRNLK